MNDIVFDDNIQEKELSLHDEIIERFCYENMFFKNVCIEKPEGLLKTTKRFFNLIVFNSKKIILFAQLDDMLSNSDISIKLRGALNSAVNKLSLSVNDFIVFGINNDNWFFFNKYNDNLIVIDQSADGIYKVIELIENDLLYGSSDFDYSFLRELSDKLTFSFPDRQVGDKKEKIQVAADGKVFLRKHGTWKEASELDSEKLFLLSAFGGMFGAHLFYQNKKAKGLLYFLTLGLFGIGWFFDSLEILFGLYKDREGKYLIPVERKLPGLLKLLIGFVIFVVASIVFMFLYRIILEKLSDIITSITSNINIESK